LQKKQKTTGNESKQIQNKSNYRETKAATRKRKRTQQQGNKSKIGKKPEGLPGASWPKTVEQVAEEPWRSRDA
jgi:hypothetical protein